MGFGPPPGEPSAKLAQARAASLVVGHHRAEGRPEPVEAYAADALADLAAAATAATTDDEDELHGHAPCDAAAAVDNNLGVVSCGPATAGTGDTDRATTVRSRRARRALFKVICRVDLGAWLRGYPVAGEVAELVGFGPVAVSAIRDMIDSGDAFLAAVATKGQDVVSVVHLGRRPTATQQTALEWLSPACTVEGCPTQAHLEIDHRVDWAKTHFTVLDLLDRLCVFHHKLKTHDGWALIDGRGKRAFVAPDDPRHPQRPPPPNHADG